MTLVQPAARGVQHRSPGFSQAIDLFGFDRVICRNSFQQSNLVFHQAEIGKRPFTRARHLGVSMQGLPGLDDALIGFFGGHGGRQ